MCRVGSGRTTPSASPRTWPPPWRAPSPRRTRRGATKSPRRPNLACCDFVAPRLVRLGDGALQGGGHVRGDALGVVRPDPTRHIPRVVQVLLPVAADLGPDRVDQDLAIGGEIRIRTQGELVEIPGSHRNEALARGLAPGLRLGRTGRPCDRRNANDGKRLKIHGDPLPVFCKVPATHLLGPPGGPAFTYCPASPGYLQ